MMYLLKKYKKLLILISFPYLYILMLLTLPTPFHGTAPGGLMNVSSNFLVESVEMKTNFHTIYVLSYNPLTPFQRFLLENNDITEVRPMTVRQKDMTLREQHLEGQLSKMVSYRQSIIKAYQMAALEKSEIEIDFYYEGLILRYRPSHLKDLKIGDLITKIDGQSALGFSHEDFLALAYQDKEVVFTIQRTINQASD
jgi:Lon-like protease